MSRRAGIGILIAVVALLAVLWFVYGETWLERHRFYRFDTASWKASTPEQRYYMATYLIAKDMVVGKRPEEIVAMLGEPDSWDGVQSPDGYWLYNLGLERGSFFRIDDDWLELVLKANAVKTARIRPD